MNANTPKRWSVSVSSSAKEPLKIFCDGRPLTQSAPATVDHVSPVEYLLISVAACFALSCRAALKSRKRALGSFEVVATGEKASDPPSRISRIDVVAAFRDGIDEAEAAAIAADAKLLCTVTNTIAGSPRITVSARSRTSDAIARESSSGP